MKKSYSILGTAYGSTVKMPMWFKHFGRGSQGAGEAYHIGIFGKTGSGKSVLAKMIMTAYSKHTQMGIFVLDPQGEFAKDFRENSTLKDNTLRQNGLAQSRFTIYTILF